MALTEDKETGDYGSIDTIPLDVETGKIVHGILNEDELSNLDFELDSIKYDLTQKKIFFDKIKKLHQNKQINDYKMYGLLNKIMNHSDESDITEIIEYSKTLPDLYDML